MLSCNECDFETQDKSVLQEHISRNIHDFEIKNNTLKDQETIMCHLCEIEVSTNEEMDSHLVESHKFMCCEQCEYLTDDKLLLNQQKKKHTSVNIFRCWTCEFEYTRQAMLENHLEEKHSKEKLWWHENQTSDHHCEKCGKTFKNLFVKIHHLCKMKTSEKERISIKKIENTEKI